jgi:hypothetical protein
VVRNERGGGSLDVRDEVGANQFPGLVLFVKLMDQEGGNGQMRQEPGLVKGRSMGLGVDGCNPVVRHDGSYPVCSEEREHADQQDCDQAQDSHSEFHVGNSAGRLNGERKLPDRQELQWSL